MQLDGRYPLLGVIAPLPLRQDQRRSGGEGAENVQHREVEGVVHQTEESVVLVKTELAIETLDGVQDTPMSKHDALRPPRGARGIEHIGQLRCGVSVRCRGDGLLQGRGQFLGRQGVHGANEHRLDAVGPLSVDMFAIGQQQFRTDVRQHGVSSLDGLAYVYGDVGTLRQQDAQDGSDLRGPFVEKQGDGLARPAAGGTQVTGDGHGPCSKLTVVPFACAAQQSRALGKIQCAAAEATMQVAQGQGALRSVLMRSRCSRVDSGSVTRCPSVQASGP